MGQPLAVFVAGTDTGVGKTVVATGLLRAAVTQGKLALGMKPVAAGREPGSKVNADVAALAAAGNVDAPLAWRNPYAFDLPIAPHIAAARADTTISLERVLAAYISLANMADVIVVEGAGGLLVPLGAHCDMLDVPVCLGLPVVLVVGIRLGCLNHALLSEIALRSRGVTCCGWVANRLRVDMEFADANVEALQERFAAPLLADLSWGAGTADLGFALDKLQG